MLENYTIRITPKESDIESIRKIVKSTNFFYDYEIDVAVELIEERIKKGAESGYDFIFIDYNNQTMGYACYGSTPCTKYSYDLYWIAILNDFRNHGLGKIIVNEVEKEIKKIGGKNLYIETSSQEKYLPTQKFYENCGYKLEAILKDFYNDNDNKLIYSKNF